MSIHYCHGFKEIAPQYQTYIFDIWGVIHNGAQLFPGVHETLTMLKEHKKRVCFLSNSPRAGSHHEGFFAALGITRDLYDFIYTSGDGLFTAIENSVHATLNDPFFFMGDEMLHKPVWESLPGERVPLLEEARYILCTGPMEGSQRILQEALSLNLPLVCSNPDRFSIEGNTKTLCAGSIAESYEKMGGTVIYCGKPEPFIYQSIFRKLGDPELKSLIAVGDGLFTDIKGANGVGLDSVFIHGGLHSDDVSFEGLDDWFGAEGIRPQYVMPGVMW